MKTRETIFTIGLQGRDAPRIRALRRALKEGMKPSRWYHDDPADTGSLYRKRTIAGVEICADIVKNSPDNELVGFARIMLADFEQTLPKTFAEWLKGGKK